MSLSLDIVRLVAIIVPLIHLLGFFFAQDAIWRSRTSQGATAWAIALVSFPYLSIPFYLILGRSQFNGYVQARRSHDTTLKTIASSLLERSKAKGVVATSQHELPTFRVLENLARMPFTEGNTAELLIDGEATFAAIFQGIEAATEYVLVQFYIARDDELGKRLGDLLARKSAEGVVCYYLYDEVGSHPTGKKYWRDLKASGVKVAPFNTRKGGWRNRFQLNFRNHRKIVVIDGEKAFVGGHNVGDDYLGKGPMGPWRDTHVEVQGPMVPAIQLSFVEDWHWAQDEVLNLRWEPSAAAGGDLTALVFPTGPADDADNCTLLFSQLIQSARRRLWISSPYFVVDGQILSLLKLAALRGVDVRILVPAKADHFLTFMASFDCIEQVERIGVKLFRYATAFPHQKVVLVDDNGAAIGTANLDNRSLRLNFEIMLLFAGESFVRKTAEMLEADFAKALPIPVGELATRKLWFRMGVRFARLFSPIL